MRKLQFQGRVGADQLHRKNETEVQFYGMSAGAKANEMFLADWKNRVVRLFNMSTGKLNVLDEYQCPEKETMYNVAYIAHTDTLLIATSGVKGHIFRSFSRADRNSEWHQCHSFYIEGNNTTKICSLSALSEIGKTMSETRLVFGVWGISTELRVLAVDYLHTIQARTPIQLPGVHYGFDAKLVGDETRLAVALCTPEYAVALFRIAGDRAEELAKCRLREAWRPLFYGHSLLVYVRNADGTRCMVQEFDTGGEGLKPRRELLSGLTYSHDVCWCVLNGTLVAWNAEPKTLTTYSIL